MTRPRPADTLTPPLAATTDRRSLADVSVDVSADLSVDVLVPAPRRSGRPGLSVVGATVAARSRFATFGAVVIGLLAFGCRLTPVLQGGGLHGVASYDDGVYYSAADALIAGQVPYRDFVLLHPPGLILLLTPFAALGHLVGDADGVAVARLAMMAVGATSAVLVFLIGRRFGRVAAIGGGVLYAVWVPAINGEVSTFLECLPNALLLASLLVLGSRRWAARPRWQLAAGAALGLGMSIKIWGLAPLAIVLLWQLVTAGRRRAAVVLAGAAAATVAVCAVPFALAPGQMTSMVVTSQLQRSVATASLRARVADFTPVHRLMPHASGPVVVALVLAVGLVGLLAAAMAVRVPAARVFVALLIGQGIVLCASPPYFNHYGAFLAPAVALTAAVGAQGMVDAMRRRAPRSRPLALATMGAMVALLAVAAVPVFTHPDFTPFDRQRIGAVLAQRHCVVSDSPGALALAGVLTRNLSRGCPTRIDVSGVTYNEARVVGPDGRTVPRERNPLWQKYLMDYLLTGDAAITTRSASDGLTAADRAALRRRGILYSDHFVTVYG